MMQLVIDSQRLFHVVWHPAPRARYALITSWESDHVIDRWIRRELPAAETETSATSSPATR